MCQIWEAGRNSFFEDLVGSTLESLCWWPNLHFCISDAALFGISMKVQALALGRLFEGSATELHENVATQREGVLFGADEWKGSQKGIDMWLWKSRALGLIEVADGQRRNDLAHRDSVAECMKCFGKHFPNWDVKAVILAPNCESVPDSATRALRVLCGKDARHWLGGLTQALPITVQDP